MTTQIEAPPTATTGRVLDKFDGQLHLGIPGTDYRLHLRVDGPVPAGVGQRMVGTIRVRAKRVDVVNTGGRFVEPVFGRPRRLQGRIIGGDVDANQIHLHCGGPVFVCDLTDGRQKAGDFAVGQLVAFDVESGAAFEPL